ncbi:hypothetical protein D1872_280550 [compost metagenome]
MKKQKTNSIMANILAPFSFMNIGMKKARQTSQLHRMARKNSCIVGASILCSTTLSRKPFTLAGSNSPVSRISRANTPAPSKLPT